MIIKIFAKILKVVLPCLSIWVLLLAALVDFICRWRSREMKKLQSADPFIEGQQRVDRGIGDFFLVIGIVLLVIWAYFSFGA